MNIARLNLSIGAAVALLGAGAALPALSDGEGEIIILRDVPPRITYREAPPGDAFTVRTAPPIDLSAALTIDKVISGGVTNGHALTDLEAATITATGAVTESLIRGSGEMDRRVVGATSVLSGTPRSAGVTQGSFGVLHGLGARISPQIQRPTRTIRRSTSGIAGTVLSAVPGTGR